MQEKETRPAEKQKSESESVQALQELICRGVQIYSAKMDCSDSQISKGMGKDASYVNKLYTKSFIPSLRGLCDLCDYFGVSVIEFLHPAGQVEQALYSILTEEDILSLIQMIQHYPAKVASLLRAMLGFAGSM